ncbi:F-box/LRR-repeat protein [Trifolium pratense]|uniref:F-box/LRR-repeat protein n=1 Tax=Trifolium pratense TaxID=57577 RepID=A0A2K3LDJ6_TRIPR|nr:F-box/LRR-repeat protein [Trifolium pratense]
MAATAEDRISSLSDDILHRILSFNTTKDAVTASTLSKRWVDLWHTIPFLNFTNNKLLHNSESILRFNLFVCSVLLSRSTVGGSINSFHLDVRYDNRKHLDSLITPNLNIWLKLIVKRQLNHLNLHLSFNDVYDENSIFYVRPKLPNSIFSCKTLVVLNLSCFDVKGFSFSNIEFGFPSLKTLHLTNISFDDDENFMLLLAGCSVLEDLKVCKVFFDVQKEVEECQMAESLSLSKLIRADITYFWSDFPIKALFNSKFLRMQKMLYYYYELPIFHNLTHLVINEVSDKLPRMLKCFPKLQNLVIYQKRQTEWDWYEFEDEQESWVVPKSVPRCFSLNLRTCIMHGVGLLDLRHDIISCLVVIGEKHIAIKLFHLGYGNIGVVNGTAAADF